MKRVRLWGGAWLRALRACGWMLAVAILAGAPEVSDAAGATPTTAASGPAASPTPVWRVGALRGGDMLNDFTADGRHSGLGAEYAEQVAQQLGVALQVVPFDNVPDLLNALRQGRIDIVPYLTRTADREREFSFSEAYASMPYKIVARSDAPLYWNLDSLRGRRLALAASHPLRELLAQRYADIEIVTTASGAAAMDAVAEGRADAAVEVKLFANLRIHDDNDGVLRAVSEVDELPAQFHFAAGPSSRQLIPRVNLALQQIPQGERERIWRRWVAIDLEPGFPWQRYRPLLLLTGAAALLLVGGTLFWMRRLQREVVQRRRSEERLADIGAALPCVAFRYVLDVQHAVVGSGYYSAGSTELLGERPDPSLSLLDNIGPRLRSDHLESARRLEAVSWVGNERLRFIAAYQHPDGRERWLHVESVAKTIQPGLTAWTGTAVDITAERVLQERVEREAEARNLMLASASHELRAPTHTLSLALQSLASAPQGQALQHSDALRVAQDAVRTLGQLLNDVLDAARLDRGELQLRPQVVQLRELVDQVSLEVRAWAGRKGLEFSAEVDADVPPRAQVDPLRLRQILTNLLSNAVKYTGQGHVRLHLGLIQLNNPPGPALRFEVLDSGPGIALDRQSQIFAPYRAAEQATAPVPEGSSGLGLSISRRLAQLMGGGLELASQAGQGTRVWLTLPLPLSPALTASRTPVAKGSAVVLCEDDPTCLLLMGQMLRAHGYTVIECSDAAQALHTWREADVAAIVTDLHMDGMDGMALVQRVRNESAGRAVRLVVCSGNPVPTQATDAPAPPYDAWLTKPVQMSELLGTLAELGVTPPPTEPLTAARGQPTAA